MSKGWKNLEEHKIETALFAFHSLLAEIWMLMTASEDSKK